MRIDSTWKSVLTCQEGHLADGAPALPKDQADSCLRVVTLRKHGITENMKILEFGSGGGGALQDMINAGYKDVTGLTLGKANVKHAKDNYNIDLLHMDFHFTNFPNSTFDAIIGWHTLEHSPSPLLAGLEFNRVLKNGGKLFMQTPGGEHWFPCDTNVHHISVMDGWYQKNLLTKCGFIKISIDKISDEKPKDARMYNFYGEKSYQKISPHLKDVIDGKFLEEKQ